MTIAKRVLTFVLMMTIAMSILIMPVSASEYIPTCWCCGKTYITPTGNVNKIWLGDGYYVEYEYHCYRCGCNTWIAASLLQ